jgi:ABC-type phosphate/phosphonate transport system substrate-binding protein
MQSIARARVVSLFALLFAMMASSGAAHALVFAINEGVTYRVTNDEIRARYAAIASDLGKILKQPVTIEPISHYPTLRQGLDNKSYDLAMVHPAHISIQAIKNQGYHLIAVAKGFEGYAASFLVRADSPLKSLADLEGKRLGAPDEDSITSWMVRASLRDALKNPKSVAITYTRYQDAVPFFVENTLTHAGATAANAVIKDWQAKGGKVLVKSKAVPIKHLIAAPSITPEQVTALREYFVALDATEEGRKKLEPSKLRGFMAYDEAAMLDLGKWLGL